MGTNRVEFHAPPLSNTKVTLLGSGVASCPAGRHLAAYLVNDGETTFLLDYPCRPANRERFGTTS